MAPARWPFGRPSRLAVAKQRLADQLGSAATAGEGRQNMLCAYLAGALLVGLLGNALVGAWWLDPTVGLLIAGVAVKEGVESWNGEGCCVSSPLDGVGSPTMPVTTTAARPPLRRPDPAATRVASTASCSRWRPDPGACVRDAQVIRAARDVVSQHLKARR